MRVEEAIQLIKHATRHPGKHKVGFQGGCTKSALIPSSASETISVIEHCGVVAYDPSEYLITAKAGTTIAELKATLAEHHQYMPFDPLFSEQGATLGGTIASGLSGPVSMLRGRLRDSLMAIEIIDGLAERVRGGGRVVKNAAGFDIPKMMLGSYGRFGLITEATLKVFPQPTTFRTICVSSSLHEAMALANRIQKNALPLAGLNLATHASQLGTGVNLPSTFPMLLIRIAGFEAAVGDIQLRLTETLPSAATVVAEPELEKRIWRNMNGWIESSHRLGRLHCDPRKTCRISGIHRKECIGREHSRQQWRFDHLAPRIKPDE